MQTCRFLGCNILIGSNVKISSRITPHTWVMHVHQTRPHSHVTRCAAVLHRFLRGFIYRWFPDGCRDEGTGDATKLIAWQSQTRSKTNNVHSDGRKDLAANISKSRLLMRRANRMYLVNPRSCRCRLGAHFASMIGVFVVKCCYLCGDGSLLTF